MAQKDIALIDKNMAVENRTRDGMDWYTVDDDNFELNGLYWRKKGEAFRRLPFDVHISDNVNALAGCTAGVMVRFRTDAAEIRIHAVFNSLFPMDHMPCTGKMGFDLYTGSTTNKCYTRTTRFAADTNEYNVTVFGPAEERKMREFTIHFPLYSHPDQVFFGLTEGAEVLPPTPWKDDRPVIVYGTSIQQGGCASRPGMCHSNIMSRMLDRPFINLGFSGNGKGEPEMAQTIAQIENPAMFVLDYDANAMVEGLRNTLPGFIDILREKHPETPILLVSHLPCASEFSGQKDFSQMRLDYTQIHLAELTRRREAGDKNIHFLDGSSLYGSDASECTVDGVHATDYGFAMIAKNMAPVIERILLRHGS